ncbi:YbjQ family protein [Heliorestis acidaminivorans]|uniref:UPF0145 protein F9B85_11025 n=1 Tax=Heliorestis acidaminivorans TaxID=553427 RepID=A0A6I0EYZ0_9FIRM|nr:YbjQ family protein [Heliorestis acidaminivorans]KAB2951816.1 YbjQ family protein [Heliorestis acidaminivorans]
MLITNTETIADRKIVQTLGLVRGSSIRAKHIGSDIVSGLRQLVGGEMKEYGKMVNEARNLAIEAMLEEARMLGADAVVNVRFSTSSIMQGAAEVLVFGTAVKTSQ